MLIGLTGGIACGKSTVSALLRDRGGVVIDADQVARDVVAPGSTGLAGVIDLFGAEVLGDDGTLDRKRLGALIFADSGRRQVLERLLHPLIAAESMAQIKGALEADPPMVIYDAPLLIEVGRAEQFRPLVVVAVPPEIQRARLMGRDGLDIQTSQARIDAQMPIAEKVALADHVINNGGSFEETETQVDALWKLLTQTGSPHV